MKLNSLAALNYYVKDLQATKKFYLDLGFREGKEDDSTVTVYLNWFSIVFMAIDKADQPGFKEEATLEPKGSGIYIMIKVDDVDEYFAGIKDLGFKPSTEPRDWPGGRREFVLRDPDGYKLVFFQKK